MRFSINSRKIIHTQHFNAGIRLTAAVLIPAFVLYQYSLLGALFSIPFGTVCVGLTDSPGPYDHRKNTLVASLIFNFFVAIISGYLHSYKIAIVTEIIVFGMFFSLITVYGNRISSIGSIALFVFIFNIDINIKGINILYNALWFSLGSLWYILFAIVLQKLRPFRLIQQLLGENIIETANYLRIKSLFYLKNNDENELYKDLIKSQVFIDQQHENLRELIFRTREVVNESTVKGRTLLFIFLNNVDLFERIITAQQDYQLLHTDFDDENILNEYHSCIFALSETLKETGINIQKETAFNDDDKIDKAISQLQQSYTLLRSEKLNEQNVEAFIKLRNILDSIEDLGERIKQLQSFTAYQKKTIHTFKSEVSFENFISHTEINPRLFIENFTLQSANFRHAVRLTTAMLIGYFVSFFFPFGHDYWILLTVVAIIKPAYSITKQRNFHRLVGTLLGAAFSFGLLYLTNEKIILFIALLLAMIIAYTFIRIKYLLSSAAITVYVILSFYFLNPASLHAVFTDRIIDTAIGSFIAFVVSINLLPTWEHEKIKEYMEHALQANHIYFLQVARLFLKGDYNVNEFKLARKNAFVSLSNLSDNFQRMMSEPKRKRIKAQDYHKFVATSHLLTSYIASLSYYSEKFRDQFPTEEFLSIIKKIDTAFISVENFYNSSENIEKNLIKIDPLELRIQELLAQRKDEIAANKINESTAARKQLLPLKTISDQLKLIYNAIVQQEKILKELQNA